LGPVGTAIIRDYIERRKHLDQEPQQFVVLLEITQATLVDS